MNEHLDIEALIEGTPLYEDRDIAEINATYALVIVGGTAAIMKFKSDGRFELLKPSSFTQWFSNHSVTRSGPDGKPKSIPLAKYWLDHKERRQYEGIVFKPKKVVTGYYNLWNGFSVEPKEGECSKFKAHLRDNVFGEENFEWGFAWFAQMVQHPETKPGTSIVLRGKQGVGKTKVGQIFGSLFPKHYVPVANPRYVTGRFNSHMVSCILLVADEAFWAGDRTAEGQLKDLVTGEFHFIEYKGKEPEPVDNLVRLFVVGNQEWMVPAGFEERRFAVFDVSDNEMDNGGREALLYELLNFDLSKVNLREIPKTAALLEQKVQSQDDKQGWWLDFLHRGELPEGCDIKNRTPANLVQKSYLDHAKERGVRRRAIETALGIFLRKWAPGLVRRDNVHIGWSQVPQSDGTSTEGMPLQGQAYDFPPLKECREVYEKKIQQPIEWDDKTDWGVPGGDGDDL
jgi:Family of unknown function (DUF5906)